MAFWNAPETVEQHPYLACQAMIECQQQLTKLNAKWQMRGFPAQVKAGVGINTGEMFVGNMGYDERMSYTVRGDSVNTAARIEKCTRAFNAKILVSHSVYQEVQGVGVASRLQFVDKGDVSLVGKTKQVHLWELVVADLPTGKDFYDNNAITTADLSPV